MPPTNKAHWPRGRKPAGKAGAARGAQNTHAFQPPGPTDVAAAMAVRPDPAAVAKYLDQALAAGKRYNPDRMQWETPPFDPVGAIQADHRMVDRQPMHRVWDELWMREAMAMPPDFLRGMRGDLGMKPAGFATLERVARQKRLKAESQMKPQHFEFPVEKDADLVRALLMTEPANVDTGGFKASYKVTLDGQTYALKRGRVSKADNGRGVIGGEPNYAPPEAGPVATDISPYLPRYGVAADMSLYLEIGLQESGIVERDTIVPIIAWARVDDVFWIVQDWVQTHVSFAIQPSIKNDTVGYSRDISGYHNVGVHPTTQRDANGQLHGKMYDWGFTSRKVWTQVRSDKIVGQIGGGYAEL